MRSCSTNQWLRAAWAVSMLSLAGCYEEYGAADTSTSPPSAESSSPSYDATNAPRPALGGAKRAAQNTVDRLEQRQRELEEMIEEDQ